MMQPVCKSSLQKAAGMQQPFRWQCQWHWWHFPTSARALKVRRDIRVINKSVFLAPGINIEGQKELPGKCLAENKGAKFWLNVLTEPKNRGGTISSSPVLTDASRMPSTWRIRKPGASCESCIWFATACCELQGSVSWRPAVALQALDMFCGAWGSRYPPISRSWQANRANLATFSAYPAAVYTTDGIRVVEQRNQACDKET